MKCNNSSATKNYDRKFIFAGLLLLLSPCAYAENIEGSKNGNHPDRHGPPAVALSACENLDVGNACSFIGRHKKNISGQCIATPDEKIACAPEGHRPPSHSDSGSHPESSQ